MPRVRLPHRRARPAAQLREGDAEPDATRHLRPPDLRVGMDRGGPLMNIACWCWASTSDGPLMSMSRDPKYKYPTKDLWGHAYRYAATRLDGNVTSAHDLLAKSYADYYVATFADADQWPRHPTVYPGWRKVMEADHA